MKVLLISSATPIRGGVSTYTDLIAQKLRNEGHTAQIIGIPGNTLNEFQIFSANLIRFAKLLFQITVVFVITLKITQLIIRKKVLKELKKDKYDVVHAQDINSANAVSLYCSRNGIRLIMTVHGHPHQGAMAIKKVKPDSWLSRLLLNEEIKAYKMCDHIIAVSCYSYDLIKKHTVKDKVSVIHNFVDCQYFHPVDSTKKGKLRQKTGYNEDDFILIYAGRLFDSKGIEYIIESLSKIRNEMPVKLIIAGSGPEEKKLVELVNQNGLKELVNFTGEVDKERLLELYNCADAFIMASVTDRGHLEGTPMSMLEAMACGLPVITTSAGGIGDVIINMKNGLIIEEKSSDEAASAIKLLYQNRDLYRVITDNAMKDINTKFSLDIVIQEILKIYNEGT